MKRLLNLAILIAFSFCYLEWPSSNSLFIVQGEYEIVTNTKNMLSNFTHPIIIIGFLAQLIVLYAAIVKDTNKKRNTIGIVLLSLLVLLFLIVGILSANYKIIFSTLPFLGLATYYFFKYSRKIKNA